MRRNRAVLLLAPLLAVALAGCASSEVRQGGGRVALGGVGRVFLAPVHNATPDETAGRAVTELAATTLLAYGVPLAQTEDALHRSRALAEEGKAAQIVELARSLQCTHVLFGTVTEYRYKSDLDGSPIVSVTMRLADTADGATVWQGTSTKMTQYFGSLSRTAQEAVDNLVQQMTGTARRAGRSRGYGGNYRYVQPGAEAGAGYTAPRPSRPSRGKYEPDVEQIRRRGDQ
jgi:polysaccharide biosynthesis protein PelC